METPVEKSLVKHPEINPVSKLERRLSPQEQETLNFVELHKQSVAESLTRLVRDNRFVLVG